MKMTQEVKAALETLKQAAENDYERLTIERMEKAIKEPPQVKVLDDRRQEFNGKIYFRSRSGYYFTNYNLHVVIWEMYHGEVPANCQVHHGERGEMAARKKKFAPSVVRNLRQKIKDSLQSKLVRGNVRGNWRGKKPRRQTANGTKKEDLNEIQMAESLAPAGTNENQ